MPSKNTGRIRRLKMSGDETLLALIDLLLPWGVCIGFPSIRINRSDKSTLSQIRRARRIRPVVIEAGPGSMRYAHRASRPGHAVTIPFQKLTDGRYI